jgi:cytochrome c553
VVVSDDGRTAFVSHAVGARVSAVTLDGSASAGGKRVEEIPLRGLSPRALEEKLAAPAGPSAKPAQPPLFGNPAATTAEKGQPSCQGFSLVKARSVPGRIFAPEVFVDPGDFEQRPDGYGDVSKDTETPNVAVIDEDARVPMLASVVLPVVSRGRQVRMTKADPRDARPDCLLPRAAAIDEATSSLLVTCFGIDAVVAYDAKSPAPLRSERRRWTVGSGPSGIAVDEDTHRGVTWSQFDRTVATFALGGRQLADERTTPLTVERTAMPALREKLPAEYALGRVLFHAAGDLRLSGDGRACASCHPDGRDDGITWATPDGPRRSIMLAGRVSRTPPYSWNGNEHTLAIHLASTFDRLSGNGLHGLELDALVAFVTQMPAPPPRPVDASDKARVERGRNVFASAETGCATCHGGAELTDGQNHEVSSKHKADRQAAFNTPSLRFVSGTGPYFHDGRYGSLREMLDATDGTMGRTKQLAAADRDALEAFLRSL